MLALGALVYRVPGFVATGVVVLPLLGFGCSKGTVPETGNPPDTGPLGALLSGSATDSALTGTSNPRMRH